MTESTDKEWLTVFMSVYKQARPTIENIAKLDSDGHPASLDTLVEGYKVLPPVLQSVKGMPKPSNKELRKIKDSLEKTLEMSIKAGEMALKMIDDHAHGARTASRMHFASIVGYVNYAGSFHRLVKKGLTRIGMDISDQSGLPSAAEPQKTFTLAQAFFIPLIQPHIKKPLFGKPRLPLANFLTVGGYLYDTGAVLGWVYRDSQLAFERVVGQPETPGKLVGLMRLKAKERMAEAKSGDDSLALLVYKTQVARLGHPMEMSSTEGMERFANWVKKQSLDLDIANSELQILFAEGVGYGLEFPEETQRRWKASYEDYEKQEHILSWREAYQYGIVHNSEPPTQTWDERVSELKDALREYITESMPELLNTLFSE